MVTDLEWVKDSGSGILCQNDGRQRYGQHQGNKRNRKRYVVATLGVKMLWNLHPAGKLDVVLGCKEEDMYKRFKSSVESFRFQTRLVGRSKHSCYRKQFCYLR